MMPKGKYASAGETPGWNARSYFSCSASDLLAWPRTDVVKACLDTNGIYCFSVPIRDSANRLEICAPSYRLVLEFRTAGKCQCHFSFDPDFLNSPNSYHLRL